MKYTIEGLSQQKLVEWKLDGVDAIIIRYFIDFWNSEKMTKITHDGKTYFWLSYQHLINNLPILQIKSKDALRKRFKKYTECGLMEHYTHKTQGTYSCYRFTNKYDDLIYKSDPTTQNQQGYDFKSAGGTTQKSEQKILPLKNSSINNKKKESSDILKQNIDENKINKDLLSVYDCWNSQPNLKTHLIPTIEKNIGQKGKNKIFEIGIEETKKAISNYNTILGSDDYFFSYSWSFVNFINRGLKNFIDEENPLQQYKTNKKKKEEDLPEWMEELIIYPEKQ